MYTKTYLKQLKFLHDDSKRPRGFGGKVKDLGKFYYYFEQWQPYSILDYGCGKGIILNYLQEKYPKSVFHGYDPAVQTFENLQETIFDCVFSNDVLEHIEPEYIKSVIKHIDKLSSKFIWLRIDTLPARKKLPDGRNAHLILENDDWWYDVIDRNIDGKIVYSELTKKGKFDIAIEK